MKIDENKKYLISAKTTCMLFAPNGRSYDYGEKIEGSISGKSLKKIENYIEISSIIEEQPTEAPIKERKKVEVKEDAMDRKDNCKD